jgi:hypothetical protein
MLAIGDGANDTDMIKGGFAFLQLFHVFLFVHFYLHLYVFVFISCMYASAAAHIGVGIAGVEGTAATMASDYAVGTFRFLHRLLFVHGYWSYHRISYVVNFIFYKVMSHPPVQLLIFCFRLLCLHLLRLYLVFILVTCIGENLLVFFDRIFWPTIF